MITRSLFLRRSMAAATVVALVATPAPGLATETAEPFEAPRDRASFERALRCLTEAVYYEARSESEAGQRAVAQVVLNRVRHPAYPNSVCGVVYQGSQRRTGCQFTFTCDGSITGRIEGNAWARAEQVARSALNGSVYRPVGLALNYHTTAIRPYWAPSLQRQAVIGAHIFYRRPDSGHLAAFRQAPATIEPRAGVSTRLVDDMIPAPRVRLNRAARPVEAVRVERAVVERPRVERAVIERPGRQPQLRQRGVAREAFEPQPRPRPRPVARPRGPRTTIENGVHVSRGS
jgi:hypothetical protein